MSQTNELVTPRKESPKESSVNDEDRISNLPDDVLSHILSYLPTICAVCTSILSKEWKYKWTSIYTINICDEKIRGRPLHGKGEATFIQFMERITSHATNVKNVRLRLFKEYDLRVIISWISALVLRNQIEVLHVSTYFNADHVILPGRLLNSTSLRDMVLMGLVFRVTSMNCFTNLTSLCLEHVLISNEDSDNDTFFFNFHVLEAFQISYCNWSGVKIVEIRAPALVTLACEKRESFLGDITFNVHSGRLTIRIGSISP